MKRLLPGPAIHNQCDETTAYVRYRREVQILAIAGKWVMCHRKGRDPYCALKKEFEQGTAPKSLSRFLGEIVRREIEDYASVMQEIQRCDGGDD